MGMDVYKVLKEMDSGELIDVIALYMDDYLQGYLFGKPCARVKTGGILCYGTWASGFTY